MSESLVSFHEMSTGGYVNEDLGTTHEQNPLIEQPRLKMAATQRGAREPHGEGTYVLGDQGLVTRSPRAAWRHDEMVPAPPPASALPVHHYARWRRGNVLPGRAGPTRWDTGH